MIKLNKNLSISTFLNSNGKKLKIYYLNKNNKISIINLPIFVDKFK